MSELSSILLFPYRVKVGHEYLYFFAASDNEAFTLRGKLNKIEPLEPLETFADNTWQAVGDP